MGEIDLEEQDTEWAELAFISGILILKRTMLRGEASFLLANPLIMSLLKWQLNID